MTPVLENATNTPRFVIRFTLGVLIIQILTFGILIWNDSRLLDAGQNELMQSFGREHSLLLAQALGPKVAINDRATLLAALERLKDNHSLRYAAVYNTQRELLASLGEHPPLAQTLTNDFQYQVTRSGDLLAFEQPIIWQGQTLGIVQTGYSASAAAGSVTQSWDRYITPALLALLVAAIVIFLTSQTFNRELSRLKTGIQTLQRGELTHRLNASALDLTNDVAKAVDTLAEHLQNYRSTQNEHYDQLQQESQRLNHLLSGINAIVWEVDPQSGCFRYVSAKAEQLLGYPVQEWSSPDFIECHVHPSHQDLIRNFLTHPGKAADSLTLDFRIFSSNGDSLWLRIIRSIEIFEQSTMLTGLLLDVTDEKRTKHRITYLADHDPLTQLINRRRFQEELDEHIASSRRYEICGTLLFIDLDQFKYINDSYGHHTGDEYLCQVSMLLSANLGNTDVIGRLGGDEFGIILPHVGRADASKISTTFLKNLNSHEFVHDGRRIPFNASIGIALFPEHGSSASELLAKADSAMYSAKDKGRNTYCIFDENTRAALMRDKIHWEELIRDALKKDGFQLYFQPIVNIKNGEILHYESLLRMTGEDGNPIPPSAFIGIAERFGMIREIDHWVVANAIRIQGEESVRSRKPVTLTVNLSGRHFGHHEILETIQKATHRYGANPGNIIFEVTETAAVENFNKARDFIKALQEMGYKFALDDFGAGFSSFDYLKHMPVDYIKIDGSFVRNLNHNEVDRIFVKAIAQMASSLNVQTIAEFVENREIVEVLKQLEVPLGQGYFFAKPAPHFHALKIIPNSGLATSTVRPTLATNKNDESAEKNLEQPGAPIQMSRRGNEI